MISNKNILVDTNIIIYLDIPDDENDQELIDLKNKTLNLFDKLPFDSNFFYNLTIFKEVAVGMETRFLVDKVFEDLNSELKKENLEIMFSAARVHKQYVEELKSLKKEPESLILKSKTIPNDCVIGATAEYYGLAIMTNNGNDFRKYFPNVELIELD